MEVGEEDMPRLEQRDLLLLRLLDLDDHVGGFEHRRGIGKDFRSRFPKSGVGAVDAAAGLGLDHRFVPGRDQLGDRCGGQADPIFVVLDLLGHTDAHGTVAFLKLLE